MKMVKPGFTIIDELNGVKILRKIERIGRVCYKSEDKITDESAPKFVKMLIDRGHEAMIEHVSISVLFVTNRRVSHEIVRHRVASYGQESQRYVDYEGGLTFIDLRPHMRNEKSADKWVSDCFAVELAYVNMRDNDEPPQIAGGVLSNDVKTEIAVTANLREWRHILKLRTAEAAHPQMREVMRPLLDEFKAKIPVVFDDIQY